MTDQPTIPHNEATQSAIEAPSDHSLRVPCYCEENVYRLAARKLQAKAHAASYYVIFISNEAQCIPMYYQLAGKTPSTACFWDYHVLLLQVNDTPKILDIDSHLPYPCPLDTYIYNSFPSPGETPKEYAPLFRVVNAMTFLQQFCSDRRHMLKDGSWSAKPPTYSCIRVRRERNNVSTEDIFNLDSYRFMNEPFKKSLEFSFEEAFGEVLTREQLLNHFHRNIG
mmetsp:Transcript_27613/g.40773  ORF Transcript_27613/g.40773 Transcript_27613/m.40773 type:complete len:224 (+) Transcript_27613:112-783(+)